MNKSKSKVKRVKEVRLGWLEKDKIVLEPKETVLLGSFGKRIPCEVHIFTLPTKSKK